MSLNIPVLRSSFEIAKPIAQDVVTHFYKTLFDSYPTSQGLFAKVDLERQKQSLIASLVTIVDNLDKPEVLTPYLRKMGARHVRYGAEEAHYAMVGKSLLATFRHFFAEKWTRELEDQWILALGHIADQMLEGAKSATPYAPILKIVEAPNVAPKGDGTDVSQMVKNLARTLLYKALEEEMDGEFMKAARKKASAILTQALREEADRIQEQFSVKKRIS